MHFLSLSIFMIGICSVASFYCKDTDICCKREHYNGECVECTKLKCTLSTKMAKECPYNCRGSCEDRLSNCGKLKAEGWCTDAIPGWMNINCCKTCKSGPNPTSSPSCKDDNKHCSYWAKKGLCSSNDYVKKNCCKSCTAIRPTSPTCTNNHKHCVSWAKAGECKKNPAFMLKTCCLACKGTKPVPTKKPDGCEDKHKDCTAWAKLGECKKNPAYMKFNCCKSCKGKLPVPTKDPNTCTDNHKDCSAWAKQGECKVNPGYMMKECCKSCKGQTVCSDKEKMCPFWATIGDCSNKKDYMQKQCCSSCKGCSVISGSAGVGYAIDDTTAEYTASFVGATSWSQCCNGCKQRNPSTTAFTFVPDQKKCYCRKVKAGHTLTTKKHSSSFAGLCGCGDLSYEKRSE